MIYDKWFYLVLATVYWLLTVIHLPFVVIPKTLICINHGNHIRTFVFYFQNKNITNSYKEATEDVHNEHLLIL
jgi:hypothetical protein